MTRRVYPVSMTIDETTTLWDLTEAHPSTIDVLVDAGLRRMTDPDLRRRFGASITVEAAALARGMDPNDLLARIRTAAGADGDAGVITADGSGTASSSATAPPPVKIAGLVPCPVRVPMTNVLEDASRTFTADTGLSVDFDLQAAYVGTEWMEEELPDEPVTADLPDVFLSAGFRLFFTDPRFRRLRERDAFADRSGIGAGNEFARANELTDPEHRFSVVGVVPAVFMVNRTVLGDRPVPQSWEDVLTPEYENSLALPVGDFDLFDALLLGIHRRFGTAGIEQLARNMYRQVHPAQMVAGATADDALRACRLVGHAPPCQPCAAAGVVSLRKPAKRRKLLRVKEDSSHGRTKNGAQLGSSAMPDWSVERRREGRSEHFVPSVRRKLGTNSNPSPTA